MPFRVMYALLWQIAPPIIKHYLKKRARKNPDYLLHWHERFGKPHPNPVQNPIWIHAVSVGETRAAQPIIALLQKHFPNNPILLTQMTPTGHATAQTLFPHAQCRYLPYDKREWVQQFIREHRPIFGILMETEIWANLMHVCHEENVPLFLANARLSEKSLAGYLKIQSLIQPAMQTLSACFAQTPDDATRLAQIGTPRIQVVGNSKYDIAPNPQSIESSKALRQLWGNRPVFLAASTREKNDVDEAELILQQWKKLHLNNELLIIVPRHPERFHANFEMAQNLGFRVQKRSENRPILPETQIVIGDSMGEMFAYYQSVDVVFVGGSLVPTGCQNIIEPISCGKPVLFGDSVFNFQAACNGALAAKAAMQIHSAHSLCEIAQQWLQNPELYAPIAANSRHFVAQHQGASERIVNEIAKSIKMHDN
ncbi:lipid IV(A) 3-deoxy-D-manno-octulosonic acid transferase [Alysiella filiformis]|uniref:3-deoxy-D-manno-octulosonic acid transferase n=1 Tax=Alysiella filiformis DSM 16848 TaxID=1120981 RepID=A0A286EBU7_9NEIS|nr:lipid IV(A) 3-deoxy-D-manno-octulosonic acid transferase [Alysiella filiformis]QMT32564.1 lipid IV(A) 3-deoxy-D-manno-octulosonic acid transferase [Alysiella filiformis]UBQ57368.1 lipid IV(A) 3-deoxy-D-manno-octulosonic acid transferase [Alysiella filiformis DSM 16848]SOD68391.1 3-deoxy-D-manno-octulosonic-acid transferase [Alysiella filiformis DSM 16848]